MDHQEIIAAYSRSGSIKGTHKLTGYGEGLIRKVLITEGLWSSPRAEEVQELHRQGLTEAEISERLGLSVSAVNSYLPYSKGTYLSEDKSANAKRIRACRERKKSQA